MGDDLFTPYRSWMDQCSIILTSRCNIHCLACSYWKDKHPRFVKVETLQRLIPVLHRYHVESVMLTGGEPTLHPEFETILSLLHDAGFALTLVTNGSRFPTIVPRLQNRLSRLILSLDADTADLYHQIRGWNGFAKLIKIPEQMRVASPETHITICLLIQKKNYRRIPAFLHMALELPVDRVSLLVPDLLSLLHPTMRGEVFGWYSPVMSKEFDNIMLDREDLAILRQEVIPEVKAFIVAHPGYNNVTMQLLPNYANYFERFLERRGHPPEKPPKRCGFPFRELVLTNEEEIKFCFFMPFRWKLDDLTDPVNDDRLVKMRQDYLESDYYRISYCDMCMQTIRRE
jgi:Fe-coproporphyrin III synthase